MKMVPDAAKGERDPRDPMSHPQEVGFKAEVHGETWEVIPLEPGDRSPDICGACAARACRQTRWTCEGHEADVVMHHLVN